MKKVLYLFVLFLLLTACKKEDQDLPNTPDTPKILEGKWEMTGDAHLGIGSNIDSYVVSVDQENDHFLLGMVRGAGFDLMEYNGGTWISQNYGGPLVTGTTTSGGEKYCLYTQNSGYATVLGKYEMSQNAWVTQNTSAVTLGILQLKLFSINNKLYRFTNSFYGYTLSEWNANSWNVLYSDTSLVLPYDYLKSSIQEIEGENHVLIRFASPSFSADPVKQIWFDFDGSTMTEVYRELDNVERAGSLHYLKGKYYYFEHFYGGNEYGGTNIRELSGGSLGSIIATSKTNYYWYHVFSNGTNMFMLSSKVNLPTLVIAEVFRFDGTTWVQYPLELENPGSGLLGIGGFYDLYNQFHGYKVGNVTHLMFDYIWAASTVGNPTRAYHLTFTE